MKLFSMSLLGSFLIFSLIFSVTKTLLAAQTVTTITVGGTSSVSVGPSVNVSTAVSVTTNGNGANGQWRSVSWQVGSGSASCVDFANTHESAGNYQETFNVVSPAINGVYDLIILAYQNDGCNGANGTLTLTNAITVTGGALPTATPPNGNSGSIWTTDATCGNSQQDVNQYDQGDHVFINGANFSPNTQYSWNITGQPGNASGDPNQVVASGNQSVDGNGAFCFDAYTVALDDCGVYNVDFEGKGDNYQISVSCQQATSLPTGTPVATPLPTDDPEGTSTPTSTPAPTVLGDNDVCANIDGIQTSVPGNLHLDASGRNCVSFELGGPGGSGGGTSGSVLGASTTRGQVLGASTMASAGLAQDIMGIAMVAIGSGMTLTSVYASTKKNYFK